MKIIHQQTLLHYDCELIFEAVDDAGSKYLAVHHDDYSDGCEYAVVQVSPQGLAQLKAGRIDLRTLMLSAQGGKWYTTQIGGDTDAIIVDDQPTPITMCASLPDDGYYVAVNNPEPAQPSDYAVAAAEPLPNPVAPRLIEKWLPINDFSVEVIGVDGQQYIAVYHSEYLPGGEYVVVPAAKSDLAAFKAGGIGLHSLLPSHPTGEWYTARPDANVSQIVLTWQFAPFAESCAQLLKRDYFINTTDYGAIPPRETTAIPAQRNSL